MPVPVLWGNLGVIKMKFKPLRDWRKVARDVRGGVPGCGHFLPEEAPAGALRGLRRFLAHV
jgi:haloacetate dehalogenase